MGLLLVESATPGESAAGTFSFGYELDRKPSGMAGLLRLVSESSNRSKTNRTPPV
jgi:hypothetical protein